MTEEFSGLKNKMESGLDEVETQMKNMFDRQINMLSEP